MASPTQTTTIFSDTSVNSLVYNSNLALRTATISIITVVAFLGNLLLLITIALSAKFRSLPLNHYIISLSLTNTLTCILSMPTVIGYAITSTWDFGETMCNVLAHFLFTSSITMCAGITAMNLDRAIAVNHSYRYDDRITLKRTRFVIIAFWVIAIFLPLPLGAGLPAAPVKPFPHRYICSITAGSNLDYIISLYLIGYGIPCIINIASFFYIAKKALNERDVGNDDSALNWMDVKGAGYVFVLFMLWVVGEIPYIILTSVEQYHSSAKMNTPLQYPDTLDTILTWLKFCHTAVLPFATFRWRRELWTKLKDLVLCRKSNNSVTDASPRQEKTNSNSRPKTANQGAKGKFASNVPNVPTLYASKDGLHVQGNIEEGAENGEECGHSDFDLTLRSRDGPIPPITLRHTLTTDPDDTSDYETDRFSQSDPVSVKSTTSQSDTNKPFRRKANSVSTDSGLSSAQNSYSRSGKKKKTRVSSVIEQSQVGDENCNNIQMTVIADINQIADTVHEPHEISPELEYAETSIDQKFDEPVSLDEIAQIGSKPRKKKKKKRKIESFDAETNTTVTTPEVIRPPARLAPIDPETISKITTSAPQTPPLRSRVVHTQTPSSLLSEPVITENLISDVQKPPLPDSEVERLEKKKKKKRKKPRDSENDSDRGLMSSGTSTDMKSSENPAFQLL